MKAIKHAFSSVVDSLLERIERSPASDRLLLRVLFFVIIFSGAATIYLANQSHTATTPVSGGVLREGIVGTPRFVNPVLANTRADHDMTALIFDGLMKIDINGNLVPNLAESVTVSEDGLTYNVVLRQDIYFHDGQAVTTDDVLYTLRLIQDPDLKSPLRGNWSGVLLEQVSDNELNILLEEAYAPFIENFTVGILPSHLWSTLPIEQIPFSQLNTEPVGAGPFKVAAARRDPAGVIQGYTLEAHRDTPDAPAIERILVLFFEDQAGVLENLRAGELDASAYVSNDALASVLENDNLTAISEPVPRTFAAFFNQNRSAVLRDDAVRKALSLTVNREILVETALFGQGVPINGPVLIPQAAVESENDSDQATSTVTIPTEPRAILEAAGWRENNQGRLEKQIDDNTEILQVTIRTSNAPLFIEISNQLRRYWEAIGVEVSLEQFDQSDLVQSVIRPRDFEVLLFGLDMNRSYDLYPFWHSSQQDDPGLNIAQYTNLTVDDLLEEARLETNRASSTMLRNEAARIISDEYPAVFLFQPYTTYVVNRNFVLPSLAGLARPSDRFSNTNDWYTDSAELWNIFR